MPARDTAPSDATVLEAFRESVGDSSEHCTEAQSRALLNYSYLDNELWSQADLARMRRRDFPQVYVNRMVHYIGAISGREIMSRYRPKVLGRGQSRRSAGEQLDGLVRWARQTMDMATRDSDVFWHALVSGYGVSYTYPVFNLEQPALACEWRPVWECSWDRHATQANLMDRQWDSVVKWVAVHELERRYGALPGVREVVKKAKRGDGSTGAALSAAWSWHDIREGRWLHAGLKEVMVAEHEWRDDERVLYVTSPLLVEDLEAVLAGAEPSITLATGASIDRAFLEQGVLAQGASLPDLVSAIGTTPARFAVDSVRSFTERRNRPVWSEQYSQKERVRYALIAGDKVIHQGVRPAFQLKFLTCYPIPTAKAVVYRSLMDFARGMQDVVTRVLAAGIHQIGTTPRAPLVAEEDIVDDWDAFADAMSSPRMIAKVKPGKLQGIKEFPRSNFPDYAPWLQLLERYVQAAFGLTAADIGDVPDPRRVSGTAYAQIKEASSATLSRPFDSLRIYRQDHTALVLKLLPEHFTLAELAEVLEPYEQLPPLTEWPKMQHYDVVVDEVPVSPTELMEMFQMLTDTNMLESLLSRGILTEDWIINRLPGLSETDRRELAANLQAQRAAAAAPPQPTAQPGAAPAAA